MHRFLIVLEKGEQGWGAYSPDLPGCIAVGQTQEEVENRMHEAIALHLEGMKEDGLPVPEGHSIAEYVAVP